MNNIINYNNERSMSKVKDVNNRVITENYSEIESGNPILQNTSIINDNYSKSKSISHNSNTNNYLYEYDAAGNLTRKKIGTTTLNEYTYDPHGRVIKEKEYL